MHSDDLHIFFYDYDDLWLLDYLTQTFLCFTLRTFDQILLPGILPNVRSSN